MVPFKKPKGKKLGLVKKQMNQAMAKLRVKIEHAFAGLKRLRMLKGKLEFLFMIRGTRISLINAIEEEPRLPERQWLLEQLKE